MSRPGPNLLLEWRIASKLSQVQLADQLQVDQASVSGYERGKMVPRVDMAHKIQVVTGGAVPMTAWIEDVVEGGGGNSPAAA